MIGQSVYTLRERGTQVDCGEQIRGTDQACGNKYIGWNRLQLATRTSDGLNPGGPGQDACDDKHTQRNHQFKPHQSRDGHTLDDFGQLQSCQNVNWNEEKDYPCDRQAKQPQLLIELAGQSSAGKEGRGTRGQADDCCDNDVHIL